jgi:hypothetical protein
MMQSLVSEMDFALLFAFAAALIFLLPTHQSLGLLGGSYPPGFVTGARKLWYLVLVREFVQMIASQTPALWDCDCDCCSRSGVALKLVHSTHVVLCFIERIKTAHVSLKHHAWTCFVAHPVMMIDDDCV